jgi:hypothetical protein
MAMAMAMATVMVVSLTRTHDTAPFNYTIVPNRTPISKLDDLPDAAPLAAAIERASWQVTAPKDRS